MEVISYELFLNLSYYKGDVAIDHYIIWLAKKKKKNTFFDYNLIPQMLVGPHHILKVGSSYKCAFPWATEALSVKQRNQTQFSFVSKNLHPLVTTATLIRILTKLEVLTFN